MFSSGLQLLRSTDAPKLQAAFTAKELREVLRMEGIRVVIPRDGMQVSEADQAELKASRVRKRVYDLLEGASQTPAPE